MPTDIDFKVVLNDLVITTKYEKQGLYCPAYTTRTRITNFMQVSKGTVQYVLSYLNHAPYYTGEEEGPTPPLVYLRYDEKQCVRVDMFFTVLDSDGDEVIRINLCSQPIRTQLIACLTSIMGRLTDDDVANVVSTSAGGHALGHSHNPETNKYTFDWKVNMPIVGMVHNPENDYKLQSYKYPEELFKNRKVYDFLLNKKNDTVHVTVNDVHYTLTALHVPYLSKLDVFEIITEQPGQPPVRMHAFRDVSNINIYVRCGFP